VIVVDASVVGPLVADDGRDGDQARERVRGEQLAAPELIDLEVLSLIRRQLRAQHLDTRRARLAIDDLLALDVRRVSHYQLLPRAWELRDSLTPYDAAYVALAEALESVLLTADRRLTQAPGIRCQLELMP
jgi:predicted nucleic acid-binding protein